MTDEFKVEEAEMTGMDKAADFCIETLAKALGVDDWQIADGSEEWHGDVAGTIYNVLKAGRVYDEEDGRVARLEDVRSAVAGEAVMPSEIAEAIRSTEYKYFGDYEMSDDQREAVDVLVRFAQQYYSPPVLRSAPADPNHD